MSNRAVLIVILVIILLAGVAPWGFYSGWGYPQGGVGLVLLILLILILAGVL